MEGKMVMPTTTRSGFKEYIRLAYDTAEQNVTVCGIRPDELERVKPLIFSRLSE
jgi:hypothetical protein